MEASRIQQFLSSRPARYFLVLAVTFLAYRSTLSAGFVGWDDGILTNNLALRGWSVNHLLGILLPSGAAYQPVRNLALSLSYHFFKLNPPGYHVVNLLLYLFCVALAFRVLELLENYLRKGASSKGYLSLIGALVFALHPLHVESVAWVLGNKDLLAAVFFLSAFWCYVSFSSKSGVRAIMLYVLAYVLFLLALGSKPNAAAFPLVILAFDLMLGRAKRVGKTRGPTIGRLLARHLPYWIPAAALALYFVFFTGAMAQSSLNAENFLALPMILWAYYRLIILPVGLLHRYVDPVFQGFAEPAFWGGLAITAGAIYFLARRGRKHALIGFGIWWFYLCWLPQSNIVPIAIRVADRYVFLSLFGVSLVAGVLLGDLLGGSRGKTQGVAVRAGLVCLLGALGLLTAMRCRVWRDGETLWSDGMNKVPSAPFFYKGLGNVYLDQGELDKAYSCFERGTVLNNRDPGFWINMGYIRKKQGRAKEALALYREALARDTTVINAYNSIGNILAQQGEDSLALENYLKALNLKPANYMVRSNLASLYRKTGRSREADSLMQDLESRRLPPPVILLKRGIELLEEGQLDSARLRFERALALDADLTDARAKLGEILLRQDSLAQAQKILLQVAEDAVPDWSLYNNLALAYNRGGLTDSAIIFYRKAYNLAPDSISSTLNLAVLLNDSGEPDEAAAVLEGLLERQPNQPQALYNLGNLLLSLGRYRQAENCYLRAIESDPGNARAHLNLGYIYYEHLKSPGKALEHFRKSLELEPNQLQAEQIRSMIEYLSALTGKPAD